MTEQHRYRETRSLSRSKEMNKAIPPSPAPSNAELDTHGLPRVMEENYNYYPQEQHANMQSIHPYSQPASRHGTPGPQQQQQMYYTRSGYPQQHQQQYSTSQYPPPQQYQGHYSPHTSYDDYSSQPYSTPATSPPTPNRSGVVTRSGRAAAPKPPPATSTPTKRKKAERTKAVKKSPHLDGPMSIITKGSSIEVVDIGAYVNRSAEERRKEVATGKIPGKIKRPMNAFMLYRKAYQNRAKEWCSQHNHQVVSQVCGDSWPLEPEEVRQQFNDWSKLERDNHQKAHPGYKFTPSKPQKLRLTAVANNSKRGRYDDESVASDPDDPDWPGSRGGKRVKRDNRYDPNDMYRAQAIYDPYVDQQQQHGNRSTFHATNPGKPMPQPYEPNSGMGGHYYQTTQSREWGRQAEDVFLKKTPSPGNPLQQHHPHHYQQYDQAGYPLSQNQQYADTLHGMPTAQTYPRPSSLSRVDPSLMPQGGDDGLILGQYPHEINPAHAAHWQGSPQPQYPPHQPSQQPQFYPEPFDSYANVGVGEEISPMTGLFDNQALDKVLRHDANPDDWQIIPSSNVADESWQDATIEPSALTQGGGHLAEAGGS